MPNYVEPERVFEIVRSEEARATDDLRGVEPGNAKRKLIPIQLRMDSGLSGSSAEVACKKGCSYCCHYRVSITAVEAFAIAEHVASLPSDESSKFNRRIAENARRIAGMSRIEHLRTNIPCAFLEDGACSIYPMRPIACRGYHSLDVEVCRRSFEEPTLSDVSDVDPERQAVDSAYRIALARAQKNLGKDTLEYEMHGAVLEALTNRPSGRRWKRGKISFPSVKDRQSLNLDF